MEPRADDGDDGAEAGGVVSTLLAAMEPRADDGDDLVIVWAALEHARAAMGPRADDGDDGRGQHATPASCRPQWSPVLMTGTTLRPLWMHWRGSSRNGAPC